MGRQGFDVHESNIWAFINKLIDSHGTLRIWAHSLRHEAMQETVNQSRDSSATDRVNPRLNITSHHVMKVQSWLNVSFIEACVESDGESMITKGDSPSCFGGDEMATECARLESADPDRS